MAISKDNFDVLRYIYQSCLKIQVLIEGKKPQKSNTTGIDDQTVDLIYLDPPFHSCKVSLYVLNGFKNPYIHEQAGIPELSDIQIDFGSISASDNDWPYGANAEVMIQEMIEARESFDYLNDFHGMDNRSSAYMLLATETDAAGLN